jgi:hypothetical protein
VDLKSWWILDRAPERDLLGNMAPAFIPSAFLLPAALLALLALPRSLPWLLAALLAGILALGTNLGNPHILTLWGGVHLGAAGSRAGNALGDAILGFNQALSGWPVFDGIRFPRRWLVCSGLALSLAGSLGVQSGFRLLGRLPLLRRVAAELPRSHPRVATLAGILGAMLLATLLLPLGRTRGFPSVTPLPRVEFAEWLRGQGQGAVLQLPTQRPAPGQGFRASVPVYAGLPDVLASADAEYFQILHRHPTRHHPSLLTVRPVRPLPEKLLGFLRDLDDLALPRLQGLQPPLSATEQKRSGERRALRDSLVKAGFRWASVDLSAYEEPWLGILLEHLSPIADQRRFADGAGVLVLELGD